MLLLVSSVFVVRLFYLQVIRYDHYQQVALSGQLKNYEIPAERGLIEAYSNDKVLPIVLNETKYTVFADPLYVKNAEQTAVALQGILGGEIKEIAAKITKPNTRYVVLATKLSKEQQEKIEKMELKGIGFRGISQRTYPQGALASQLLGFVNDEGEGKYGVEQAVDEKLKGKPGELKAITDAGGVPLAVNRDNIQIDPEQGSKVRLTIDIGMQQQLEEILKSGLETARSKSGSAVIMDPYTGAIKAMANYPSYDPSEFFKVEDASVFNNAAVSVPLEVGSIMKPLTTAAALDLGVVTVDSTYYDPGKFVFDEAVVTNVEEVSGAGTRTISDILQRSLNTGASWLLMQMGGGSINEQARNRWYDYMTNRYQLGRATGIEQGYEATGYIPKPNEGYGLNIQYANTSFGQGMSATPLQMVSALAGIINGGTYYKPHLIDRYVDAKGTETIIRPQVVRDGVVSGKVSAEVRSLMEGVVNQNYAVYGFKRLRSDYSIGGKSGTAQTAKPEGGYYADRFNGMFMGFIGGNDIKYVIVVKVNEPEIKGYAGSKAAAPIFVSIVNMLINNFGVAPKS